MNRSYRLMALAGSRAAPFRLGIVAHGRARKPDIDDPIAAAVTARGRHVRRWVTDGLLDHLYSLHDFLFSGFDVEFFPFVKGERRPELVKIDTGMAEELDLTDALGLILSDSRSCEQDD